MKADPCTVLSLADAIFVAAAAAPRCLRPCIQVGSVNNTFGIQGVKEHCMFFKSIEDASALRRRISECFERAALPYVSGVVQ